jgi:hypothetical protein
MRSEIKRIGRTAATANRPARRYRRGRAGHQSRPDFDVSRESAPKKYDSGPIKRMNEPITSTPKRSHLPFT